MQFEIIPCGTQTGELHSYVELAGENDSKTVYDLHVNGRHLGFTFLIGRMIVRSSCSRYIYIELTDSNWDVTSHSCQLVPSPLCVPQSQSVSNSQPAKPNFREQLFVAEIMSYTRENDEAPHHASRTLDH